MKLTTNTLPSGKHPIYLYHFPEVKCSPWNSHRNAFWSKWPNMSLFWITGVTTYHYSCPVWSQEVPGDVQGTPCPLLTPLSAGWGFFFRFVWVFFLYLFTNTAVYPFQAFWGEAEPDVLLSLSCGCVTERGSVLLISDALNLTIIVLQTKLSAIIGIFSSVICLA